MSGTASKLLPLRIRLPYTTEEEFIDKYGLNVARGGVFVATRAMKPEGTGLAFEFVLADGTRLLRGEGVVVKAQVDAVGGRTGMTVRFVKLDAASKALIDRVVSKRTGNVEPQAPAQVTPPLPAPAPPPGLVRRTPGAKVSNAVRTSVPPREPSREEARVEGTPTGVPDTVAANGAALASTVAVPELTPSSETATADDDARAEVPDSGTAAPSSESEQVPDEPASSTDAHAVSGEADTGSLDASDAFGGSAFTDSGAPSTQDADARPGPVAPRFEADSSDGLDFAITASLAASEDEGGNANAVAERHGLGEPAKAPLVPEDSSTGAGTAPTATATPDLTAKASVALASSEPVEPPQTLLRVPPALETGDDAHAAAEPSAVPVSPHGPGGPAPAELDEAVGDDSSAPAPDADAAAPHGASVSQANTPIVAEAGTPATTEPSATTPVTGTAPANEAATEPSATSATTSSEPTAKGSDTSTIRATAEASTASVEPVTDEGNEAPTTSSGTAAPASETRDAEAGGAVRTETPTATSTTSVEPTTEAGHAASPEASETAARPHAQSDAGTGDASTAQPPAATSPLGDAPVAEASNEAATEPKAAAPTTEKSGPGIASESTTTANTDDPSGSAPGEASSAQTMAALPSAPGVDKTAPAAPGAKSAERSQDASTSGDTSPQAAASAAPAAESSPPPEPTHATAEPHGRTAAPESVLPPVASDDASLSNTKAAPVRTESEPTHPVPQDADVPRNRRRALLEVPIPQPASTPALPEVVLGIDLGTSHARVAVVQDGMPKLIPLPGTTTTDLPALIAVNGTGDLVVGATAQTEGQRAPRRAISGLKRLLGLKPRSPQLRWLAPLLPFPVTTDTNGDSAVEVRGRVISPTLFTAMLLRELKHAAATHLGRKATRAVICAPTHFTDRQCAALREAATLAGLDAQRILIAPAAAALAYAHGRGLARKRVLVVDLGGGGLQVCVVQVTGDDLEVITTGGDATLGGMDFDARIAEAIASDLSEQGVPKPDHPFDWAPLRTAAESTKVALSSQEQVDVTLPSGTVPPINRERVEALTADLAQRVTTVVRDVLESNALSPQGLDAVLLVGGQSAAPLVRRRLEESLGVSVRDDVDTRGSVALGAALLGQGLLLAAAGKPAATVSEVLSSPLAVAERGGTLRRVLDRNTRLPATKTLVLPTVPGPLELALFQGAATQASDAEYLGRLTLNVERAGEVELHLALSVDGALSLEATLPGVKRHAVSLSAEHLDDATFDALIARSPLVPEPERRPGGVLSGLKKLFGRR
ncbi:hypothetical protein MVI01_35700 [Myxococcus virescens]|uniref:PilZ domain-containing protein n=1 Tax=Myxococcus virescens TaxID=83456 RepID=A0A511HE07_9BACT|nr:hypothetical protein MVI01_35700 [Myxococcus virescens]